MRQGCPSHANRTWFSTTPTPSLRTDWSDTKRLFSRFTFMDSIYSKPNYWKDVADPGCCDPMFHRPVNVALDYTQNIGTNMVMNLRYGLGPVTVYLGLRPFNPSGGFKLASLGLPTYIDRIFDHEMFPTHGLKIGLDARVNSVNYGKLGTPSGNFDFSASLYSGTGSAGARNNGVCYASFPLGFGTGSITHQRRTTVVPQSVRIIAF